MKVGKLLLKAQKDTEVCIINQNDVKTHSGTKELLFEVVKDFKVIDYTLFNSCIYIMVKNKKQPITKEELNEIIGTIILRGGKIRINDIYMKIEHIKLRVASGNLFIAFNDGSEGGVNIIRIPFEDIKKIEANDTVLYKK